MNADSIKIECEEDGMWMVVQLDHEIPLVTNEGVLRFRIQDIAEELYDAVKREIGPWLYERDHARTTVAAGVSLKEYLADEYRHEVSTGQHAPFLCAVEDIDESGGLADDDPKSPGYHDRVVSIYDDRDKFSVRVD